MNGQNNNLVPTPPDFDSLVWECHCCRTKRTDRYIRVRTHDIGSLYGLDTGVMFVNCRYCADVPACEIKATDREFVIKTLLPGRNK